MKIEDRNHEITCRVLNGETASSVGRDFDLTLERILQITHRRCRLANPHAYYGGQVGRKLQWIRDNKDAFLTLV